MRCAFGNKQCSPITSLFKHPAAGVVQRWNLPNRSSHHGRLFPPLGKLNLTPSHLLLRTYISQRGKRGQCFLGLSKSWFFLNISWLFFLGFLSWNCLFCCFQMEQYWPLPQATPAKYSNDKSFPFDDAIRNLTRTRWVHWVVVLTGEWGAYCADFHHRNLDIFCYFFPRCPLLHTY